jgi:hypothetical protein
MKAQQQRCQDNLIYKKEPHFKGILIASLHVSSCLCTLPIITPDSITYAYSRVGLIDFLDKLTILPPLAMAPSGT